MTDTMAIGDLRVSRIGLGAMRLAGARHLGRSARPRRALRLLQRAVASA